MIDPQLVLSEVQENGVAVIRLNRPDALNALNLAIRKELADAFAAIHDNPDVRCVVLTGDEKAFAAGADLKEFVNEGPVEVMRRRSERYWNTVAATPQPVIAAINGYAMGGGLELAMACDMIVIGENAQIGQPEIKVGIMPGAGGTQRLTRAVGKFNAMKLCLTGKPISGVEAHAMGLASDVVPDAEVLETALKMATTIARMPPLAAQVIKESVIQGANASLDAALALERRSFQLLFATEDKTEGMTAFIEKRRAQFNGG
ncbi:UNVERIFIED_CONTAM: hypothetical protein GTU68_006288 [Idotea baltica]|nr:hypothetical protein [Idotea baltica]